MPPRVVRLADTLLLLGVGGDILRVLGNLGRPLHDLSLEAWLGAVPDLVFDASLIVVGYRLARDRRKWGVKLFWLLVFNITFVYGWLALLNNRPS